MNFSRTGFSLSRFRATGESKPDGLKSLCNDLCSEPQGLKPFSFQTPHGMVEARLPDGQAVPYKDFPVATQALKPTSSRGLPA
jgi:hypothetical protein